jgi:hypothetical protein
LGEQVPLAQLPQGPQAELQQMPAAHWPDTHWLAVVQGVPLAVLGRH